jgi:BRCT domain type II-containing protein
MMTKTFLAFCVLCAFVLIGCSKTDTMSNSNSTTSNSNKTTTATTSTASSAGDKIGVPECDDYLAKYEACVNGKVPEMARAQFNSAMKTTRDAWRQAASTPQGKAGLAAACKQAAAQAKTSMKPYGCDF